MTRSSMHEQAHSDSLIIQREVDSMMVWLESDKIGHIMRGNKDSIIKLAEMN